VNPSVIVMRLRTCLHHRQYSVPDPNYLWHIDGYHKLIRWRLVIHGGIDGYGRIPVYLNVAVDDRSETILDAFFLAVEIFFGCCKIWLATACLGRS